MNISDKTRKIIISVITGLMVIVGLILLNLHHIESWYIQAYQPKITRQTVNKNNKKKGDFNYKDTTNLSFNDIMKARRHEKDLPVIGVIAIPDAKVYLPIAKGVSNNTLALAAGTMEPNQQMGKGNYALAGHNMANLGPNILFSPLYTYGKAGQHVYLTDFKHTYDYQLTSRQTIDPHDVGVLNPTPQPTITLITCNETGSMRVCFKGKLVKTYNYKHTPKSIKQDLSHHYNRQ